LEDLKLNSLLFAKLQLVPLKNTQSNREMRAAAMQPLRAGRLPT
jgi:hypothetical protein